MDNQDMGAAVELVQSDMVQRLEKAQVDMQVETAKRYPRDIAKFIKSVETLATRDQETAEACFYALPRDGKVISGPSTRLAEIVAATYGNLRAQAVILGADEKHVTARGMVWDLENNVAVSIDSKRRITNKFGQRYKDDMVMTTSNAAAAIAFRNAIFKVVPTALLRETFDKIKKVAMGDERTLRERCKAMFAWFDGQGAKKPEVLGLVGCSDVESVTLSDLQLLRETATSIKEGISTVAEVFATKPEAKAKVVDPFAEGRQSTRKPKDKPAPESEPAEAPAVDRAQMLDEIIDWLEKCAVESADVFKKAEMKVRVKEDAADMESLSDKGVAILYSTMIDLK